MKACIRDPARLKSDVPKGPTFLGNTRRGTAQRAQMPIYRAPDGNLDPVGPASGGVPACRRRAFQRPASPSIRCIALTRRKSADPLRKQREGHIIHN